MRAFTMNPAHRKVEKDENREEFRLKAVGRLGAETEEKTEEPRKTRTDTKGGSRFDLS